MSTQRKNAEVDGICQDCMKPLIVDPDGGPGYPTLIHRDADEEACLALYGEA